MAVKIWNKGSFKLVVPGVGGQAFNIGEARVYQDVEYDSLINNGNVQYLLRKGVLKIKNLDDMDIQFSGSWNETPHLTIGTHEYWIDATGTTRVVDGTPTSDTDGDPLGAADKAVSIYSDTIPVSGRPFAQVRSAFFSWFENRVMGTWDTLYKYCYWSLKYPGSTWTEYRRFDAINDLFSWMETVIPSAGGVYTASVMNFRTEERVDVSDSFPHKVVHRNSLVASVLGKYKYNRRTQPYGVSSAFNAPQYYTNYYGELAQRIVQADTGVLPIVNEDNAIWHTIRVRSKHGLPKVGSIVNVPPNARGAVWDTAAVSWVVPAPAGSYVVGNPFILQEYGRKRILQVVIPSGPRDWGLAATSAVSAIIFPVDLSGRWRAYLMYPYNYDSFATESFDLGTYELTLKLVYRNTSRPKYVVVADPWYTVGTDDEHYMWSHWTVVTPSPLKLSSVLAQRQPGCVGYNPDSNSYPDKVYVARRNKLTGMRSAWYPLYSIRRRVPHATYRLLPARCAH